MIKVYFDSTEVSTPLNWQEFRSVLKRTEDFYLLLFNEGGLNFSDSAYDYISNKISEGFCTEITISVHAQCGGDSYAEIFKGIIYLADVELNERTCTVKITADDASFYAKIFNNKRIKTSLSAGKSKNGVDIATPTLYNLDLYTVTTNTFFDTVASYRIEEVFRYMIAFMTDDTVDFASTTFSAPSIALPGLGRDGWQGLALTCGAWLRDNGNADAPPFSFEELYKEINARIPLVLLIENPFAPRPTVRIEERSYIVQQAQSFQADDVYEIITKFNTEQLYAIIQTGGPVDTTIGLNFPSDVTLFGWKEEEFHTLGNCNSDTVLDLSYDWYSDSNAIENIITSSTDEYDKDLFIIDTEYTNSTTGRTVNSDFLNVGFYYFNELLTNNWNITRWIGGIPTSVASYLAAPGSGTFYAYLGSDITHTATVAPDNDDYNPLAVNVEWFDVTGDYNNGTYRFVAPQAGVYKFDTSIRIETGAAGVGSATAYFQAYLRAYDVTNTIKNYPQSEIIAGVNYGIRMFTPQNYLSGIPYIGAGTNADFTMTGSVSIVLFAGEYVELRLSKVGTTGDVDYAVKAGQYTTFFKCEENSIGGGVFKQIDSDDFPSLVHIFNYPVSNSEWLNIIANPTGYVRFAMEGKPYRKAWVKEIKYDHFKGIATFELITDKNSQDAAN